MLDATGVTDETELRDASDGSPEDQEWASVLDGSDGSGDVSTVNEEASEATDECDDVVSAVGDTDEDEEQEADDGPLTCDLDEPDDAVKGPSPDHIAALGEYIEQIQAAREEVREQKVRLATAKELASAAKRAYESAVDALAAAIDAEPGRYPLIEHLEEQQVEPAGAEPAEDGPEAADTDEDDESWREVALNSIGISAGVAAILEANPEKPIVTIGDLADWTAAHGDHSNPLSLIPKIGGKKCEHIELYLGRFWEEWNEDHPDRATDNEHEDEVAEDPADG